MKPFVLFVVGPTGAGKTQSALRLARVFNGEIISADSMQVYRGMDIGTAKASRLERREIPHHLLDIRLPSRLFSVFEFRKLALRKIREIVKRGRLPIIAGGTGLYIRSLTQGLAPSVPPDLKFRRKLEREAKRKGLEFLYEQLKKTAPERAAAIKPGDQRRIIRALETVHNAPQSQPFASDSGGLEALGYQPVIVGVNREREILYAAIDARVERMFRKGIVREARKLAKLRLSRTARQAVGYRELFEYFSQPISIKEVKDKIKQNTRRLAKRQMTWFRKEPGINWVIWIQGEPFSSFFSRLKSVCRSKIQK